MTPYDALRQARRWAPRARSRRSRAHYGASARQHSNALHVLGAARALGNPAGWARGVAHGVESAIVEPINGISEARNGATTAPRPRWTVPS